MTDQTKPGEVERNALKRAAAEAAVKLVTDGMIVGLGTGSTAAFAVEALAVRHREGLRFLGIPTSERTGAQASRRRRGRPHPCLASGSWANQRPAGEQMITMNAMDRATPERG